VARRNLPDGTHTDFETALGYQDYLKLDAVLASQTPLTDEHDELLFIIIHQASELWLKLVLHELTGARDRIRADDLRPAFKMLSRVAAIQTQLIQSWSVLSTLTPADYLRFRDSLGHASGLQSHQYRQIEFFLGNKNAAYLAPHAHIPDVHARLTATLEAPSLYDEAILLLVRRGFVIDEAVTTRDWAISHTPNDSVQAAWLAIYRDTQTHWSLYELAEKLLDLEDSFQQWRFRHLETVKRIIGFRRGTGGTSGVDYLQGALNYRFFPELWDVRTAL
jgi:tryptophan 2,3-dioxygenase